MHSPVEVGVAGVADTHFCRSFTEEEKTFS